MSGTSLDGVDAALLELDAAAPDGLTWRLLAFVSRPYDGRRRDRLRRAADGRSATPDLCRLGVDLGQWLADAVEAVCAEAGVATAELDAVGSHGQTVWHDPPAEGHRGASLQIGDPATLAERTGAPVVSDFRSRDLAAGGHGAPLVPFADRILFSREGTARALQNLGGMGNVTWIPARGDDAPTLAFDTGPGVALLDAAAERATGGRLRCDRDGALAARGRVDEALLERLLSDPFFREAPPRSTGRESFGAPRLEEIVREQGLEAGDDEEAWCDLLATLTALTARSVADAYRRWVLPRGVDEVVLTGGGARNPALVEALRRALDPLPVGTGPGVLGMDPDAREAAAFAVLAWAHLAGVPGNVPEATGARGHRVLGSLTPAGPGGAAGGPAGGA